MIYNNTWLLREYRSGQSIKFIYFWGHKPGKDGSITRSCFSQWWHAPFTDNGIIYKTAEHWMMAGKARLFNDQETCGKVLNAETPAEAKKLGRMVRNFDPVVWDQHKFEMVVIGNYKKFNENNSLKEYLLNTQDSVLVEASPTDNIWGIGMSVDDPLISDPVSWRGENLLGYALMEVRDKLRQ